MSFTKTITLAILILITAILGYTYDNNFSYLFVTQLMVLILLIVFYKNNNVILLFLIYSLFYLYIPKYFVINELNITAWDFYQNIKIINISVILNIIFFIGFIIGLRKISEKKIKYKNIIGREKNNIVFYFTIIILCLCLIFGLSGENIFKSGSYGSGEVTKNTLFEYFILFYYVAIVFINPNSRIQKIYLIILLIFYVLKGYLFGGRVESLQLLIAYVLIYRNFLFGYNSILLVFSILFVLFLNVFIGLLRQDMSLIFNPSLLLNINNSNGQYLASQFGDAYQSTLRVIGLVQDGYISYEKRLLSFISIFFGSFVATSFMPDFYNLASYKQEIARSGGGGLISGFSYVWLSYAGPLLFGFFVGFSYRLLYYSNNILLISYGFLVAVTFPRWFNYYPLVLFKFCLFVIPLIIILKILGGFKREVQQGDDSIRQH